MKNHTFSAVGDVEQRQKLDALSCLFQRVAIVLGPCKYGTDQARELINALPACKAEDRPDIIKQNWSPKSLTSVDYLLQQIDTLERDLAEHK